MRHEELTIGKLRVGEISPDYRQNQRVPASGLKGYPVGHEIILSNALLGMAARWVNVGDLTGSLFVPVGPAIGGYGIARAGHKAATTGSATQNFRVDDIRASDIILGEYSVSDDSDQISAVIAQDGNILWTLNADPLAAHGLNWLALRSRCLADYDIFAAGTRATVGGGVAEAITITGAQAGDIALVTYSATDDTDIIAKSVVTANTLTVTMNNDPGATHGHHYAILRPRGSFKPSHYIAYAGNFTCVAGSATQTITVAGVLATDVVIVKYRTTDDTDFLLRAVPTANTITVLLQNDPLAAHSLAYMVLRAYPA